MNILELPGGRYAVSRFAGHPQEVPGAWDALYRSWLPDSGYQPDDRPCLELYRGHPEIASQPGAFRAELCLPVRPL